MSVRYGALDTLTFYTWWREGTALGLKRFTTTIEFDLTTCNFNVRETVAPRHLCIDRGE